MSRRTFTAVVSGEITTARSGVPFAAVAIGAGFALLAWLATVLVELAEVAGVLLAVLAGLVLLLRRRSPRDTQLLAERFKAMHAEIAAGTRPQQPTVINVHAGGVLYLTPGHPAGLAVPVQGTVINQIEQ